MAWTPIDLIVPQYVDVNGNPYSGAVLKAYAAGTTTNISMATDSDGGTTFTSIALNSLGYPEHNGSIVIPFVSQNYKLALYANQAAADANTPAIWTEDNIMQIVVSGNFVVDDAVSSGVTNVITATHTTTGTPVAGIGAGIALVTETAEDNNETGGIIESVSTDVTGTSEDFDLVFKTMAGGAAAAEKLRIKSTGALEPTGPVNAPTGAAIASASTINLDTATGNRIHITGTTTITAVTLTNGPRTVVFDGILTLTHHVTNNNLPSGANITTAAGDRAIYESDGTTVYCIAYIKANGFPLAGVNGLTYVARSSNTKIIASNSASLFEYTSGTFSQTFDPCASLGSSWFAYFANVGSGVVTLDPDGSELIGGVATAAMNPGDIWLVTCTGTALTLQRMAGRNSQVYSSGSGNFTVPAGVYRLYVEVVGGGGGVAASVDSGGGGGGYSAGWINTTPGATIAYSVGAGGTSGPTAGGNTTFGALTGNGGSSSGSSPPSGGSASGGDINIPGGNGGGTAAGDFGIGGGTALAPGQPSRGTGALAGVSPGGGAGSNDSGSGAAGAAGIIIITWT